MEDYELGKRIYELRRKKGISQKELGAMLGVSNKAVSKWETGASAPKTENIILLAEALGTTTEELLSGKTNNPDTIEKLSAQASSMLYKQELSEKHRSDADRKYKNAKTYLIAAVCIFITMSVASIGVGLLGSTMTQLTDVTVEEELTSLDIAIQGIGMGYFIASIFTGFVWLVRIIKRLPTCAIVICSLLFPITLLLTEMGGLVMTIPTIMLSIKEMINHRRLNTDGQQKNT